MHLQELGILYSVSQYLETIEPKEKREFASVAFKHAMGVFGFLSRSYGFPEEDPIVQIRLDSVPDASGFIKKIILTSGMVDKLVFGNVPSITHLLGSSYEKYERAPIEATAGLIWTLAHEWMHEVRCHTAVAAEHGNEQWVWHALEYDSDACAAAALYRFMHSVLGEIETSDTILVLTVYSLFWSIRGLKSDSTTGSHPAMELRWHYLIKKLASLNPDTDPDNNSDSPEHERKRLVIEECLTTCENFYANHSLTKNDDPEGNLLPRLIRLLITEDQITIFSDWTRISSTVERISNTKAVTKK